MYNVVVFDLVICCLNLRVWLFSYWLVGLVACFVYCLWLKTFCVRDFGPVFWMVFGICVLGCVCLMPVCYLCFCGVRFVCFGCVVVGLELLLARGVWVTSYLGLFYCALQMLCFTGWLAGIGCVCLWFVCFCFVCFVFCDLFAFGFVFSLNFGRLGLQFLGAWVSDCGFWMYFWCLRFGTRGLGLV